MKQRLTWLALGATVVGLALPAYAMAQSGGSSRNTLDDNGVPGELRGNCDEAEHANDPACLDVAVPAGAATTVTVATSISVAGEAAPLPTATTEVEVEASEPAESTPDNTVSRSAAGQSTVAGTATTIDDDTLPGGDHCLEPEHVNDPACTGAAPTARSGGSNTTVAGNGNRGSGKGEDHSGHGSEGTSTTVASAAPAPTVAASQPTVTTASTDSSGSNSGKGSGSGSGSGSDDNGSGGHGSDD